MSLFWTGGGQSFGDSRIYNDYPFFVTSRAFRRDFLTENNIFFDEDMDIAEDCFFDLEAIGKADRICYTPTFIGYRYYINSGSMLSSKKTDQEILKMSRDSVRLFEKSLDIGNYTNTIIMMMAFVISRYLSDPSISTSVRREVKELFEPYLLSASPVPRGRFPEPMNSAMNTLPYEIIMDVSKFERIHSGTYTDTGSGVLYNTLKNNQDTDMGRRYHFNDIGTIRGFQSQVPLTDIRTYEPMIRLCMQIGEKKIFCEDEIKWYCRTLMDQFIPVTKEQTDEFVEAFEKTGLRNYLWVDQKLKKPTPVLQKEIAVGLS